MIALLLICVAAIMYCTNAINVIIAANGEECFVEELTKGDVFTVEYQVKTGGRLDIDLMVSDPNGEQLYAQQRRQDGRVTLSCESTGMYKVCLGNKFSSVTEKYVDFEIMHSARRQLPVNEIDAARAEDVTGIENSVFRLGDTLESVEKELRYQRSRIFTHHRTNESTHQRVVYWSFFEAAMVLAIGVWQVWYLKRFFEVRRAV